MTIRSELRALEKSAAVVKVRLYLDGGGELYGELAEVDDEGVVRLDKIPAGSGRYVANVTRVTAFEVLGQDPF